MTTNSREFRRFLLVAQLEAKEIGRRIAQARNEAGLTQEQLAELAPFSYRSLQDYEQGVTIPYRQMREISKILGRPVEWFLHGDDEEEQSVLDRLEAIDEKLDRLETAVSSLVSDEVAADLAQARAEAAAARAVADRLRGEARAPRAAGIP